jgi:transposase
MDSAFQPMLPEIPEQSALPKARPVGEVKFETVNRQQTVMVSMYVEDLIPADHKARAIWEMAGRLDLSQFSHKLRTWVGCPGRPAWDPQLLVSVWVYAYSEGISSAREIERLMEWEPGLQWLGGLEKVNHHTLSSFRVEHREALEKLFAELLVSMEKAGLLSLEQVMHDGTKIRSQAGADSFRREKTARERLAEVREALRRMADPGEDAPAKDRKQAGRERAVRQRAASLEAALKQIADLQSDKNSETEKAEVRVSLNEPEARLMKHGDNAIAPSYNAQITTEAKNKIILGAHLSQCSSDAQSLSEAIEEVGRNLERRPAQVVVDGGYTNRGNIVKCVAQGIDLVGSLRDPAERSAAAMKSVGIDPEFAPSKFRILENGERLECPVGCVLKPLRRNRKRGDLYQQYRAQGADCGVCACRGRCCPNNAQQGRTVSIRLEERAEVADFRKKMESVEYRTIYRKRGAVAEFPNAWIKDKLGLRKFRVRGLKKAGSELLWACLTYNIMQWVRLVWRQGATA